MSDQEEKDFWYKDIIRSAEMLPDWTRSFVGILNTSKTREALKFISREHIKKGKDAYKFSKLLEGNAMVDYEDYFFLVNMDLIAEVDKFAILSSLMLHPNPRIWYEVFLDFKHRWERLSQDFEIYQFGAFNTKIEVSSGNKEDRVCRFCGSSKNTFEKEAHAISLGIGNELVFSLEECDSCNGKCNDLFERNLIHLMDFRRKSFEINTRKKFHVLHGENFAIEPLKQESPHYSIKKGTPYTTLPNGNWNFKFFHNGPVVDQDIYRCFVKSVVDLIPGEYLPYLKDTVKWLMKEKGTPEVLPLPPVRFAVLPDDFCFSQPVLYLFIRKDDDKDVPFCTGVLHSTDVAYQFVVPFVDIDGDDFLYEEDLKNSNELLDTVFPFAWELQTFTHWWESYIWVYWEIDPRSDSYEFRDAEDPIFAKRKEVTDEEDRLYLSNFFIPKEVKAPLNPLIEDKLILEEVKSKDFRGFKGYDAWEVLIELDFRCNGLRFSISFPFIDDWENKKMKVSLFYKIKKLDRILRGGKYVTGDTFITLLLCFWEDGIERIKKCVNKILANDKQLEFPHSKNIGALMYGSKFNFIITGNRMIESNFFELIGNDNLVTRFKACNIKIKDIKR